MTAGGLCLALSLSGALAASPVRLVVGAEGRKVIYNESSEQRSRRFAGTLLAVPALYGADAPIDLESLIRRHSGVQNLDPRLVRAVIQVESGYNLRARSNKGAMGLMQLMPGTAVELAVSNPYDPDQNVRGGTTYLRQMIDRFNGRLDLAVAAYNAGAAAVERYHGVPPYADTVDYVQRVLALSRGDAGNPAFDYQIGRRPKPYVTRNAEGRLVVTTALGGRN
jgi:soluble lytic murein transglycosylase-like protein